MKWKIIEKNKLPVLIGELAKEYEVFAPVKEKSIVSFEKISSENQAYLDFRNTKKPPKEVFFPQTETLFTYKTGEKDVEIVECQEAGHYPMIECPVFFASKIEEFCS